MKSVNVAILILGTVFSVSVSHGESPAEKPSSTTIPLTPKPSETSSVTPPAASQVTSPAITVASTANPITEVGKCAPGESRNDRLATIDKVIAETKAEFEKDPDSIKDEDVRARVGTFAAGAMSDNTDWVSLDRWCWADFYEARKSLESKNEARAADYAQGWKTCLEASFPDRVDLARPYFGCFPGKPKSKR